MLKMEATLQWSSLGVSEIPWGPSAYFLCHISEKIIAGNTATISHSWVILRHPQRHCQIHTAHRSTRPNMECTCLRAHTNQNKIGKLGFGSKRVKITCLLDGQLKVFKITVCTEYQRNNTNSYNEFSLITFNVLSIKSWDSETKQGIQNRKSKSVCTLLKSK